MTRKRPDKLLGVYGKILEANGSKQLNSEEPKKKKKIIIMIIMIIIK